MIKEKFASHIRKTKFRFPSNYEVLDFEQVLKQVYPDIDLFVTEPPDFSIINNNLVKNQHEIFPKEGVLIKLDVTALKYFQKEVGFNNLHHTDNSIPKYVLQYNDIIYLFNGYHRTLIDIHNGVSKIEAYYLNLNTYSQSLK